MNSSRAAKITLVLVATMTLLATVAFPRPALAAPPSKKGGSTANLAISGTAPEQASEGDVLTLEYKVTNLGPATASNVKLTSNFNSSEATFLWAHHTEGECGAPSGSSVTCSLGTLEANADHYKAVTLAFRPLASGTTVHNSASTSSSGTDPDHSNNSASLSVPIVFDFGCEGSVVMVHVSAYEAPSRYYSCERSFTLSSAREVLLELRPKSNFHGGLTAKLSAPSQTTTMLSASFVAGEPVNNAPTSKSAALASGPTWNLTVTAEVISYFVYRPGFPLCGGGRYLPVGVCLPFPLTIQRAVYVPLSSGGYGGRVTEASN